MLPFEPQTIRVLLIEDDQGDAELINLMFDEVDRITFQVKWAKKINEALDTLATDNCDAVLLDLTLPDAQGLEAFIRLHDSYPELPIVVLSGLANEKVISQAMQSGAQDYLIKGEINSQSLSRSLIYAIERKKAEKALRDSQKLASLGTLAAGIAHEINSPLQVITGISESLIRKLRSNTIDSEQVIRNLETINRNSWRVADIVRSLLTYARATVDEMHDHDLNEIVKDSLLLIEHQLLSWANITVHTLLSPLMPPLLCDRNKITQVILNLLTNARDALPSGGEITISTLYDDQNKKHILQVKDNGKGIPPHQLRSIFDPFFTTKPIGQGTGLGLSIVLGIVRAHGGAIDVESQEGVGTTFTITLPSKPSTNGSKKNIDTTPQTEGNTSYLGRFD